MICFRTCPNKLIWIKAPHFTAGVLHDGWVVTETAPILRWMNGWYVEAVKRHCEKKGYGYEEETPQTTQAP